MVKNDELEESEKEREESKGQKRRNKKGKRKDKNISNDISPHAKLLPSQICG